MAKQVMIKTVENQKKFYYEKNGIHLEFTLNIDNSGSLKSFLTCLTAAKTDVEEAIAEMKN